MVEELTAVPGLSVSVYLINRCCDGEEDPASFLHAVKRKENIQIVAIE